MLVARQSDTGQQLVKFGHRCVGYAIVVDFGIVLVPDVIYRTPAYIDSVRSESQSEQAGLQPDDLIVFLNNQLVPSIRVLDEQLGRLQVEDDVALIVRRGNQLTSVMLRAPRKPN